MELRRGDVVTVALPGDFGKPRPAVVISMRDDPNFVVSHRLHRIYGGDRYRCRTATGHLG